MAPVYEVPGSKDQGRFISVFNTVHRNEVKSTLQAEGVPGRLGQANSAKERDRFSPAGHQAVFLEKEKTRVEIKQGGGSGKQGGGTLGVLTVKETTKDVGSEKHKEIQDSKPLMDINFYVNRKRCPSLSQSHAFTC